MFMLKWRIALAALFALAATGSAYDESGIEVQPDRTFIHKESKSTLTAPAGWNIIAPYRLRRGATSTVLGLGKDDQNVSMTIIWSPLGNRPFSDFIKAGAVENLGEEYALLQTVYGKEKIGQPFVMKVGPYSVYKIPIDDGPEKNTAGAVYMFEAGPVDNHWKVKVRAVYPQLNRDKYVEQVEDVINKFGVEK